MHAANSLAETLLARHAESAFGVTQWIFFRSENTSPRKLSPPKQVFAFLWRQVRQMRVSFRPVVEKNALPAASLVSRKRKFAVQSSEDRATGNAGCLFLQSTAGVWGDLTCLA
jgi:hypothetical protein